MKNNFIFKLLLFLIFSLNSFIAYSEELKFEASSIEIIDKDKIVIAKDGVKILSANDIVIDAKQMRYDKEKKFLEASGDIVITNKIEKIKIYSDNIAYDKDAEKIVSSGNVEVKFENDYFLKTEQIFIIFSI